MYEITYNENEAHFSSKILDRPTGNKRGPRPGEKSVKRNRRGRDQDVETRRR